MNAKEINCEYRTQNSNDGVSLNKGPLKALKNGL